MKKSLFILTMLLAALSGCQKPVPVVEVTGISIAPTEMTLVVGEAKSIEAVLTPGNATDKSVKWSTSDIEVAYVSEGKVLGLSAGEAVVSASTPDGAFKAECKVTVVRDVIHVTSISVTPVTLALEEGQSARLSVNVLPVNADDRSYSWSSSDSNVVSVDSDGKVTAVKAGEATVTATATDGALTASCAVTVDIVRPKSVTLDITEKSLYKGESFTLTATVLPIDAVNKAVIWSSGDSSIAQVDDNGNVIAVAEGKTTIVVTTVDGGLSATCVVTVSICHPESVTLNHSSFTMTKGDTLQLEAVVGPDNAENKSVTWSSSDTAKASVSETGLVTALGPGEVTITVTTVDGGKTATCVLNILDSGAFTGGNEGYTEEDLN